MSMTRRGFTLVELMIALVLAVIVTGVFIGVLVQQQHVERRLVAAALPSATVDEALAVLASVLARIAARDTVIARADTALQFRFMIGAAVACQASGDSILVADSSTASWWESTPDTGDVAEVADVSGAWSSSAVLASRARASNGPCGTRHHALQLAATMMDPMPLVRVTRAMRFMIYRASDGKWWLGQRLCAVSPLAACGAAQPIAGPLSPPPVGLQFVIDSSAAQRIVFVSAGAGNVRRTIAVPLRP